LQKEIRLINQEIGHGQVKEDKEDILEENNTNCRQQNNNNPFTTKNVNINKEEFIDDKITDEINDKK